MRNYTNVVCGEKKRELDERVMGITKCYILLNYAYNSEEEEKIYKEEFKKRYKAFYKTVNDTAEYIEERHMSGEICDTIKDLLALSFYQSTMSFLGEQEDKEVEFDSRIEEDYDKKTSTETTRRNFYYNNNCEFGTKTRDHVNLTQYSVIDPEARDNTEDVFIFSSLTTYFRNTFASEFGGSVKKIILQDGQQKSV